MRTAVLLVAAAVVVAVLASSHSEAPGSSKNLNADLTDFYMFRSYETGRDQFVTFVMNVFPLQAPNGGPNYAAYSSSHFYEINLDYDHDGIEDQVFQFYYGSQALGSSTKLIDVYDECDTTPSEQMNISTGFALTTAPGQDVEIPLKFFGPVTAPTTNMNWQEWVQLNVIEGPLMLQVQDPLSSRIKQATLSGDPGTVRFAKPFDYAGEKTFGNAASYNTYAQSFYHDITWSGCATDARLFVGPRRESFSVALGQIFDLINLDPVTGADCDAHNALRGYNIGSFILEVPIACLVGNGTFAPVDNILAGWLTVHELTHDAMGVHVPVVDGSGNPVQISRLGMPLVNEVVIGIIDKDRFNRALPRNDADAVIGFGQYVTTPTLPKLISLLFGVAQPTNFPRGDLVAAFLTGVQGVNKPTSGATYEALRLNLNIAPTAIASQSNLGVIGGDNAGYPNGRRPGDDVVDISLRVVMGRLCILTGAGDSFGFGCTPTNAPAGSVDFTDGAPQNVNQFLSAWPYLQPPLPGAVTASPASCPN